MEIWIWAFVGVRLQARLAENLAGKVGNQHTFVALQDVAAYSVTAVNHYAARNAPIQIAEPVPSTCEKVNGLLNLR